MDQSACPFRGFARHKLHATEISQEAPLLDAASRGNSIHLVMQNVWGELRSQSTLKKLISAQLKSLLSVQIRKSIYAERARHPLTFSDELAALEQARLMVLVTSWLSIEKERSTFEVLEPEQEQTIEIGGLSLKVRPDRVDRLEDDSLFVVDYKTGKVSIRDWFGDRPEQLQLPTYLYGLGETVTGLAFAYLNRDQFGYLGLSAEESDIGGMKTVDRAKESAEFANWQQLANFWRGRVEQMASEFIQGHAVVDPNSADSCRYCEVMPLCRIV
jgi:ATP-dependent helicase/nuclease subunit B